MSEQLSFDELFNEKLQITKPIRLIELFAGIGSQAKALKNLGVNFEHYKAIEYDKYAIASYNAIHGTNFPTMDITQTHASDLEIVDTHLLTYLLTYSFPCQDLSLAGKQRGMTKGTGTRSGLLWEVERILNECTELPQILLMENVPQVIGEKNIADFDEWRRYLRNKGYKNYTQILNAKDFGIPQNRARCFMVSILGDYYYEFPNPIPLTLKLKDMLEENVDEKFYLSAKMIEYITSEDDSYKVSPNLLKINRDIACSKTTREGSTRADTSDYVCDSEEENIDIKQLNKPCFTDVYENIKNSSFTQASQRLQEDEICSTLLSRDYKDPKCVIVNDIEYGNSRLNETLKTNEVHEYDYIDAYNKSTSELCGTIQTGVSSKNMAFVAVKNLKQELCDSLIENNLVEEGDIIHHSYTTNKLSKDLSPIENQKNLSPTLDTRCDCLGVVVKENANYLPIKNATKKGYLEAYDGDGVDISARMNTHRGTVQKNMCQTLDTQCNQGVVSGLRIRKFTPKECWRLMGFSDEDYDKASKVNSNAQLYKQAGNSIVVNVLMAIFKEMF